MRPLILPSALTIAALAGTITFAPVVAGADSGRDDDSRSRSQSDDRDDGGDDRDGLIAFGLTTDGRLVSFSTDRPEKTRKVGAVTGLSGDTSLVGIDFRVQDGLLYGVGNAGGVYTLATGSAAASKVSQLTVALDGTAFGVDFNPAADRLRVISNTGQNLRHNVNPAGVTLTDVTLTTNGITTTGVTGAAYTNNDLDPTTATTLFDIGTITDEVLLQSPANSGTLAPTGKLTVDAGPSAGLDIYSTVRNGVTVDVEGYAVLSVAGTQGLYAINLVTGKASPRGALGDSVVDLALPLAQR